MPLAASPIMVRPVTADDAEELAQVLIGGLYTAFRGIVPDASLDFSEAESAANWRVMLEEGFDPGDFMDVAHKEPAAHKPALVDRQLDPLNQQEVCR